MAFEIDQVILRLVRLPIREPMVIGTGTVRERDQILIEVRGAGISGWAESAVLPVPFYMSETPQTAFHILRDFAVPMFLEARPESPAAAANVLRRIVGNHVARAGLEMAYWDWTAKSRNLPLNVFLAAEAGVQARSEIEVGISLGMFQDGKILADRVREALKKNYHRIKIAIAPGKDLLVVERLREELGSFPLSVDANGTYTLNDLELLRSFDRFGLLMLEQPLLEGDVYEHSLLQREIETPICLDESVRSAADARAAMALGSCRTINIKPARLGGLSEALDVHRLTHAGGMGIWCGGLLETGIGRAVNMALATLPNFVYPGDISESSRYYYEDIVSPEIALTPNGTLVLSDKPGIGVDVNLDALKKYLLREQIFEA